MKETQDIKINVPKQVKEIIDILKDEGEEGFAVGGSIRDSILEKKPTDWDITTSALPQKTKEIFTSRGFRVIETGIKHGTVTILIDKEGYEVTTYRVEKEYIDNRRPSGVDFTKNLEEDLKRRDFTINALAYNDDKGLQDYFNGIKDMQDKIIRCVGVAEERFEEDALRMLRAIRFMCQLDFEIEKQTIEGLYKKAHLIKNISKERVRDELTKMLMTPKPGEGIVLMHQSGMLGEVFKDFDIGELEDEEFINVINSSEKIIQVRLILLIEYILGVNNIADKQIDKAEQILKILKYDNKTIKSVSNVWEKKNLNVDPTNIKEVKKLIASVGKENLNILFEYLKVRKIENDEIKRVCKRILDENQAINTKDLKITGKDLISIGYKPGKEIGIVLEKLLDKVLEDNSLNNKDKLISLAKRIE